MSQVTGSKVPFTRENVMKCLCGICPVQTESQCVEESVRKLGGSIAESPNLSPENVPGLYCSSGTANCPDIDPGKPCVCAGCGVYNGYALGCGPPVHHFCLNGGSSA
ncbi:MAG: DUF2769 domain-containing protein [Dehalococcoidia bacterium]|nr:DUF2769 domain-containing protein [Dehalococcoidia bacterium]